MSTMSKRVTYAFTFLMIAALIVPLISSNRSSTTTQDVPEPTEVPIPTFPPPLEDFSGIDFSQQTLHPSGLFAVSIPTGYEVVEGPPTGPTGAQEINLNNQETESVVTVMVEDGGAGITSTEDLSNYFNANRLANSWPRFQAGQRELRRDQVEDRLVIEYALTDTRQREFFARHASWVEGDRIYTARVVVPQNATDLLDFMLDPVIESIQPLEQFAGTPATWNAYYDSSEKHLLRYPTSWRITDGGEDGVVTSFSGFDGVEAVVNSEEASVADEAAARDWVEGLRDGITVDEIQPINRAGGEGWAATYTVTDFEGATQSGYAVILNGEDGKLHTAVAVLPESGINLLAEDLAGAGPYGQVAEALNTFSLVSGLNLPETETSGEATEG